MNVQQEIEHIRSQIKHNDVVGQFSDAKMREWLEEIRVVLGQAGHIIDTAAQLRRPDKLSIEQKPFEESPLGDAVMQIDFSFTLYDSDSGDLLRWLLDLEEDY